MGALETKSERIRTHIEKNLKKYELDCDRVINETNEKYSNIIHIDYEESTSEDKTGEITYYESVINMCIAIGDEVKTFKLTCKNKDPNVSKQRALKGCLTYFIRMDKYPHDIIQKECRNSLKTIKN